MENGVVYIHKLEVPASSGCVFHVEGGDLSRTLVHRCS